MLHSAARFLHIETLGSLLAGSAKPTGSSQTWSPKSHAELCPNYWRQVKFWTGYEIAPGPQYGETADGVQPEPTHPP
jgi:hypothetical protein